MRTIYTITTITIGLYYLEMRLPLRFSLRGNVVVRQKLPLRSWASQISRLSVAPSTPNDRLLDSSLHMSHDRKVPNLTHTRRYIFQKAAQTNAFQLSNQTNADRLRSATEYFRWNTHVAQIAHFTSNRAEWKRVLRARVTQRRTVVNETRFEFQIGLIYVRVNQSPLFQPQKSLMPAAPAVLED